MVQKFKQIHFMFYASLIFLIFPLIASLTGDAPIWMLGLVGLFLVAYFTVLISENQVWIWLAWIFMLVYIFIGSTSINTSYAWFTFFLSNVQIYRLRISSWRSPFLVTFLLLQIAILGTVFAIGVPTEYSLFAGIIFIFVDLLTFSLVRGRILDEMKEEQALQNSRINLLLAENERNRIGQDLHDSLGHTFAMLSVKSELAQQLLQMEAYPQAEKELAEIHQISKDSMQEVRKIVENLKKRTLASELETVVEMLALAHVETSVDNQLDHASLAPQLESTLAMILLELATNTIRHAEARQVTIQLLADERGLHLDFTDDGRGFKALTGKELHTIRDRMEPMRGRLEIVKRAHPTWIRVELPYQEG